LIGIEKKSLVWLLFSYFVGAAIMLIFLAKFFSQKKYLSLSSKQTKNRHLSF
jgi:hypothetical protein